MRNNINYSLSSDTWNQQEIDALTRVIKSGIYTMHHEVEAFEAMLAKAHGCKHAVMTNSGSSANLIMLAALQYHPKYRKIKNPNIVVPSVSWSTTYFPIHQNNFTLKFADVDKNTFNISVEEAEKAIDKNTVAVLAVNLLGNPAPLQHLKNLCDQRGITLLEDNCESFGALEHNNQWAGTFGDMGTLSFFFSHHLQTMEGGAVLTDDADLVDYLQSFRAHGWVRHIKKPSELYKPSNDPFEDSFRFVLPGYAVRPLEMSGAVGQVQLAKWPEMFRQRRKNAETAKKYFSQVPGLVLQQEHGISSWFGFGFILNEHRTDQRQKVIQLLNKHGVETRPIVAGNFQKNPVISRLNHIPAPAPNADYLHDNGFFIGNDSIPIHEKISATAELLNHN